MPHSNSIFDVFPNLLSRPVDINSEADDLFQSESIFDVLDNLVNPEPEPEPEIDEPVNYNEIVSSSDRFRELMKNVPSDQEFDAGSITISLKFKLTDIDASDLIENVHAFLERTEPEFDYDLTGVKANFVNV